ncbi:PREDICTED: uncharacterized protein LOC104759918 [Camelina sativa]|uniref:Uncharacterized protein LOC104759918 n=1 Tax=Camelina sativa TaxID=90675 RepID=A0ABM0X5M3_CAMSA|nr:PREDICTED: uncharacterized protein LOC104759918 [Camelina sativa]
MGFLEKWITWIIFCVSSVEYKVLLNGQPNGLIKPERDLRQGDPLSPYLFIICKEVLIANIRKAESDKRITSIKVANKCPPITHLLFADDSLFFCKATKEECGAILDVLKNYEAASGQQINFSKSSLQFGHLVPEKIRTEVHSTLGITNIGGMGSYLGLPESLGGSKTKVFSFVRDRLQIRTTGWTAKLLSKGGKEVMIKSVATAVPTFVMSCYRIPKTITSKLTSAVANFWWSSNGQTGGMHWLAWEKLCSSNQLGGLGFRNVDDFNTALLAKQLWRLIEVPDSLFARVFKSRYYRNSNPMVPIKSYSPSYSWRSIISARSLVNKVLITRVGYGDTISIWTDSWVPAQFPRPAQSKDSFKDPLLQMNDLIDRANNTWRMDRLAAHFASADVDLIGAIPLSINQQPDSLGWHFTKTGKYTVRSGYQAARMTVTQENQVVAHGPDITPLKAAVWKTQCPPKLQHFMWQILSGCLSVTANLRRRGISCDVHCSRCGAEDETINHALFECPPPARQAWAIANVPTGFQAFPTPSVYANLDHFLGEHNPGAQEKPDEVIRLALSEAKAWLEAQSEEEVCCLLNPHSGPRVAVRGAQLPSAFSGYRCFVDGSWKDSDRFAGAGWVCWSSQRASSLMGAANFHRSLSPLHAEVEAFVWAMRCMIGHDLMDVAFYTDCSDLVKMVSSPSDWPAYSAYLDDIKVDLAEFSSFSLTLISRKDNEFADRLARQVRIQPHATTFVNDFPPNWLV